MDDPVKKDVKNSILPDFLGGDGGKGKKINTPSPVAKNEQAANKLGAAEGAAGNIINAGKNLAQSEAAGGWRSSVTGNKGQPSTPEKGKKKFKLAATIGAGLGLVVAGVAVVILNSPLLQIGSVDFNLLQSLGFSGTMAILETQATNIMAEKLANGKVPGEFSGDLADAGIVVGQVTAQGDFVRTNNYVANIDETFEIAGTGFDYYRNGSEGELAVLFEGQVVNADDFVATVESNPRLYAAYSEALDVKARFYYSSDVDQVYRDLGLSRGSFNSWKSTGNEEEDEESFYAILDKVLSNDGSSDMVGCGTELVCTDDDVASLATGSDASEVISKVKKAARGSDSASATDKAAQLLNTAISSNEPRQAASAFLAIEEPIQRARIEGNGPVNQVMNALSRATEIKYTDVNTNEDVVAKKSIFETTNFAAAISGGGYSKNEANNFSRDRVLIATDTVGNNQVGDTTINDGNSGRSGITILANLFEWTGADDDTLAKATGSVAMSAAELNNEVFSSIVGGNRIVEGGSYLSNTINSKSLGAMPSDSGTIAAYQHDVDIALARKAEADRAMLSPFDISSPNTFMGSLVNSFATVLISHSSSSGSIGIASTMGAVADLTSDSVNSLLGNAMANGSEQKFTTLAGDCTTVKKAANVEGDLYCNSHNTISTKYMKRTAAQWGNMAQDEGYQNFVKYSMERDATVGVKSAQVCEAEKGGGGILDWLGIFQACDGVDSGIATGSKYTLSSSNSDQANMELYSAYTLYDVVSSLIDGTQSNVSKIKDEYRKEFPRDNSVAGRVARMTKDEATLALNYASYLSFIANYDPTNLYQFGELALNLEHRISFVRDEKLKEDLYCFWCGRFEYSNVRNRSLIA